MFYKFVVSPCGRRFWPSGKVCTEVRNGVGIPVLGKAFISLCSWHSESLRNFYYSQET